MGTRTTVAALAGTALLALTGHQAPNSKANR